MVVGVLERDGDGIEERLVGLPVGSGKFGKLRDVLVVVEGVGVAGMVGKVGGMVVEQVEDCTTKLSVSSSLSSSSITAA